MPFDITITREFSASHQLRLYDGALEDRHGHNWKVAVTVSARQLDGIGVVMDFHQLQNLLDRLLADLHNRHLNDLPAFAAANPSAENVALHVGRGLALPDHVTLASVQVWETADCSAVYRP